MRESVTYQAILREGRAEEREKSRKAIATTLLIDLCFLEQRPTRSPLADQDPFELENTTHQF